MTSEQAHLALNESVRDGRARSCPVCATTACELLFDNPMAPIAGIDFGYAVVACSACGMVYAASAPDDVTLARYYAELSKYDHPSVADPVNAGDQHRADVAATFTARFTADGARVLDVGCSIGVYLAALAGLGRFEVRGLDPSAVAASVAKARYGLDVHVGSAYAFDDYGDFDVISLLAVLEHLREPRTLLASIADGMKPGATLIVEVPDADRFGDYPAVGRLSEPFGEFSNEHINYFGPGSLCRLAADVGLSFVASAPLPYLANITGLLVAFRKERAGSDPVPACASAASVRHYVVASRAAVTSIEAALDRDGVLARPFVLYGAGSHSARLLAQGPLGKAPIAGVLDRNPHLAGRTIGAHVVEPPATLSRWPGLPVVVSSFHAMPAIARYLQDHFDNDVVTLYPRVERGDVAVATLRASVSARGRSLSAAP